MNKINEMYSWIYIGFVLTILLAGSIGIPILNNKQIKEYPKLVEEYNKIDCKIVDCEKISYEINIEKIQENPYNYIAKNSFIQGLTCGLCGIVFLGLLVAIIQSKENKKKKENETKSKRK